MTMTAKLLRSQGRCPPPWRALSRALLLLGLAFLLASSLRGQAQNPPPIEGVVVQISQINEDFFVNLDLDADDKGDQWVKIAGPIQTPAGKALTTADIVVGTRLRLTSYQKNEAGFLEALKVIVLPDKSGDNGDENGSDGGKLGEK